MASNEKKELLAELRSIKVKRQELNNQLKAIRDQKQLLSSQREELVKRAQGLGMNVGNKATAA